MGRLIKALIILGILFPMQVFALGLGELQTHSALNQPFDAELELITTNPSELTGLEVKLASPEDYSRAGIERLPVLNALRFRVVKKNGRAYVQITSRQAILEPYLNFLVEVNWSRGRLLREFTVLLDPPELLGGEAAAVESPEAGAGREMAPPAKPAPPTTVPPTTAAGESAFPMVYGPIRRDEKLWNIAREMRGQVKATIPQVMMALLRNNPEAFIDNNVNRVKTGYVLRIDNLNDIHDMSPEQAQAAFRHQYQAWLDYKQQRAMAADERRREQEIATRRRQGETSAQAGTAADEQGVLTLERPESQKPVGGHLESGAAGQGAESEELNRLRKQLAEAQQTAEINEKQNEAMHERLKSMEEQIAALQRLMEVRSDELTALQQQMAEDGKAQPPEAAPAKDEAMEKAGEPEPASASIFDMQHLSARLSGILQHLRENPQVMGIIGGAIFLFLTTLWLLLRRRKQASMEQYAFEPSTMDTGYEMEGPWESDFTTEMDEVVSPAMEAPAGTGEMEEDPITQADIFIAYGNLDAAIEVMERAVANRPEKDEYRDKLADLKSRRDASVLSEEEVDLLSSDVLEEEAPAAVNLEEEDNLLTDEDMLAFQEEVGEEEPQLEAPPQEPDDIHAAMADFGFDLGEDHDLKHDHHLEEPATRTSLAEAGLDFDLGDIHSELEKLTTDEGLEPVPEKPESIVDFDLGELDTETMEDTMAELDNLATVEPEPLPEELELEEPKAEPEPVSEAMETVTPEAEAEPEALFDADSLIEVEDHEPDLLNDVDEVGTKLDLARAYIDMGDPEGARSILEEVLGEGNEHQIQEANELLAQVQ